MGRLSTVLFDGCTGGRGVACRETIWPRAGANFLDAAETQASMRDVQTVRSPFPQRCRVTYLNLVAECKVIGAPNSGLEGGGPALVRFGREQSGLDAILPTLVVWLAQVAVFLSAQDGSIHRRNREVVFPHPLPRPVCHMATFSGLAVIVRTQGSASLHPWATILRRFVAERPLSASERL